MPLVTIAIPCLNASRWIVQAVQSALDQTHPELEVIVADDGSEDDSLDRLAVFGDRIRVHRSMHRGGNAARNIALHAARGEWLQFLDADDYLEPEKIERQLSECTQGAHADIIYSPVWIEDFRTGKRDRSVVDPSFDLHAQWIAWQLPQTGGALWRLDPLLAIGGWNEDQPCCQEHELYQRALHADLRFQFAPTPHAVYRLWSEETVCRRDPRLVARIRTDLIDRHEKWMKTHGFWKEVHQQVASRVCFEMARTIARYDLQEAAVYYRERTKRGLIAPTGPAAPMIYRVVHRMLGFVAAEKLAAARR